MKITDVKTFNVFCYRTNFVFVKIETDEGVSGIGEGTLEYKENALLGAIEDIKRVLLGQDPRCVERITQELIALLEGVDNAQLFGLNDDGTIHCVQKEA